MKWLLGLAVYGVWIAALVWLLRRLRPGWSKARIVTAANMPGPLLVLTAIVWAIARLGPAPAREIDATGMAMMVYMVGGGLGIVLMIAVGFATALLAWRPPAGPRRSGARPQRRDQPDAPVNDATAPRRLWRAPYR